MLPRLATLSALFAGAIPFGHMRMKTLKIDLSLPACRSSLPRCICDVMLAITKRRNDDGATINRKFRRILLNNYK